MQRRMPGLDQRSLANSSGRSRHGPHSRRTLRSIPLTQPHRLKGRSRRRRPNGLPLLKCLELCKDIAFHCGSSDESGVSAAKERLYGRWREEWQDRSQRVVGASRCPAVPKDRSHLFCSLLLRPTFPSWTYIPPSHFCRRTLNHERNSGCLFYSGIARHR